jgi:hypothetical protein
LEVEDAEAAAAASGAEDAAVEAEAWAPASRNLPNADPRPFRAGKRAEAVAADVEVAAEASEAEDAAEPVLGQVPDVRSLPSADPPQFRAGKRAEAEVADEEVAGSDAEEPESDAADTRNHRSGDRGSCRPGKNPDTKVHPCGEARKRAGQHPSADRTGTNAADSSPRARNGPSPDDGTRRSGTFHSAGSSGCRRDRSTRSIHRSAGVGGTCSCSSTSSNPMSTCARSDGTYSNTRRSTRSSCRCATKRSDIRGATSRTCNQCYRCRARGHSDRSKHSTRS